MTIAPVTQTLPHARKAIAPKERQVPQQPEVRIETVTPAIAAEYLKLNTRNRPMNMRNVKKYADAMIRREWHLSGDAIQIASDNVLLNGQTRLKAVEVSGLAQEFLVMRGCPPEWYRDADTQDPRDLNDYVHTLGIPHRNVVGAASIKMAGWLKAGELTRYTVRGVGATAGNRGRTTMRERQAFVDAFAASTVLPAVRETGRYGKTGLLSHSHLVLIDLIYRPSWPQVGVFLERALTGIGITSAVDPAHALRTVLLANATKPRGQGRQDDAHMTGFAIVAANYEMAGQKRKTLRWQTGEGESFPQPAVDTRQAYAAPFDWAAP